MQGRARVEAMRILLAVVVAAAVVAGAAVGAVPIAKPIPTATLQAEFAAFNARNYAASYTAYTPRFKAKCPYAVYRKHTAALRAKVPSPLSVTFTNVRTAGDKAYLAYHVVLGGQAVDTVTAAKPDLFVRVGGLWYDEIDPQTTC